MYASRVLWADCLFCTSQTGKLFYNLHHPYYYKGNGEERMNVRVWNVASIYRLVIKFDPKWLKIKKRQNIENIERWKEKVGCGFISICLYIFNSIAVWCLPVCLLLANLMMTRRVATGAPCLLSVCVCAFTMTEANFQSSPLIQYRQSIVQTFDRP